MLYELTHPWINFELNLDREYDPLWYHMGRACAKIKELPKVAAPPEIHRQWNRLFMIKGVLAGISIEGNTLTEKEVKDILDHKLTLPPSKKYLEQQVRNMVDACNKVIDDVCGDAPAELSSEYICQLNQLVLRGLKLPDDVEGGVIRKHSVLVSNDGEAPAEDCEELLMRLCKWLASAAFHPQAESMRPAMAIIQAIVAHVYLAWIHPFGDGNGRTARLVEVFLLLKAGIPLPAVHLLSNFFNKTRDRYYSELSRLSKPMSGRYPPIGDFVSYAVEGLADELDEQLELIVGYHLRIIWENYVYNRFQNLKGSQNKRIRDLLLSFELGHTRKLSSLQDLPPKLYYEYYKDRTIRTLQRDLRMLIDHHYLESSAEGFRPRAELILRMLPMHTMR